MRTIQLNSRDIELLYCFPKPPADLQKIVFNFTFINRAAPPSFEELASCLIKGQKAGIIRTDGKQFVINDDWYKTIHAADATAVNEIQSMLEFEEEYLNRDIEVVSDAAYSFTENAYESILATLS